MSENLIINDSNVVKVVTILKYVTLTYNGISPIVINRQIPGEIMEKPLVDVQHVSVDSNFKYYKVLYSWLHGSEDSPILVPSINGTYTPNWCNIRVSNFTLIISYDQYGGQHQDDTFNVYSDEPLYFKGETLDGAITRNVSITNPILVESSGQYRMPLTVNINGVVVLPGAPRDFTVKVSIYKDRICSKYLGYINIATQVANTSGPGE